MGLGGHAVLCQFRVNSVDDTAKDDKKEKFIFCKDL